MSEPRLVFTAMFCNPRHDFGRQKSLLVDCHVIFQMGARLCEPKRDFSCELYVDPSDFFKYPGSVARACGQRARERRTCGRANVTPAALRGSKEKRGGSSVGNVFAAVRHFLHPAPEELDNLPWRSTYYPSELRGELNLCAFMEPKTGCGVWFNRTRTIEAQLLTGESPFAYLPPPLKYIFGGDDVDLTRKVEMEHCGRHPRRRLARGHRRYLVALVNVDRKWTVKN
jgi:hypothetical protein